MRIVELNNKEFDEYAKFHPLNSYCQNSKYALVMSDYGYSYDYIGFVDDENTIKAAALILTKKIQGKIKYGYAPKGFLVNYYDTKLLDDFLNKLREWYKAKDFVFIKFNPEIIIGDTDKKRKYVVSYNGNVRIIDHLKNQNVKRRLEINEFELMMPKFYAYMNLKKFDINNINRGHRKKIKKAISQGMSLEIGSVTQMDTFYKFVKNKTTKSIQYFRNLYNIYNRDNSIDLLFVKIDFEEYLKEARRKYDRETANNDRWNSIIQSAPNPRTINNKINSDKKLQALKQDIIKATDGLKKHKELIIAGALVIKHSNRISIIMSGYDEENKHLNPNYYLYYAIFERYKAYFNFCDMDGISGIFDNTSKYKGLNDFKIKFNPSIYEFIGEFDLICNDHQFKRLIKTSFIEDEFSKHKY